MDQQEQSGIIRIQQAESCFILHVFHGQELGEMIAVTERSEQVFGILNRISIHFRQAAGQLADQGFRIVAQRTDHAVGFPFPQVRG